MEIFNLYKNLKRLNKIEVILATISALAVMLSFVRFPFGDELLILSVGLFSLFYIAIGVFIYKFDKSDAAGTKFSKVVLSFYACNGYGVCLLGILFRLLIWPGEKEMMLVAFATCLINIFLILVFWLIFRNNYLKNHLITSFFFFIVTSFFYLIPIYTIIDIRYWKQPDCGTIIKQSYNDPRNEKLRNQASECKYKKKYK